MQTIGISDIAFYIPSLKITIDTILHERMKENPKLAKLLQRAKEFTGQKAIRFPNIFEDTVTIAANAVKYLLDNNKEYNLSLLRYLAVGTETSIDMSKPVSSYVAGVLQRIGYKIPTNISIFQVQHACAGGTIAMLSQSALLQMEKQKKESGIVICSDIARYEPSSTAEITQGAGAVSILIEKKPRLIKLNLETIGYASTDVDDFFRPLGSITAKVKGQYSIQCYYTALNSALEDYANRSAKKLSDIIHETDIFIFHVPFAKMAIKAHTYLLRKYLSLSENEIHNILTKQGVYEALEITAEVGNIYTGALYLNMMAQLAQQYAIHGNDIIDKKILISSYGSGNTMTIISGEICKEAPHQISQWNIHKQLNHNQPASWQDYTHWINSPLHPELISSSLIPQNTFFLEKIREDGYRQYGYNT